MFWKKKPQVFEGNLLTEISVCPKCKESQFRWYDDGTSVHCFCEKCQLKTNRISGQPKYVVFCRDCKTQTPTSISSGTIVCKGCGKTLAFKKPTKNDMINCFSSVLKSKG